MNARILLADDHPLILQSEKGVLPDFFEIIGTASDGPSLVDAAIRLKPDLILIDISMPLLSGIETRAVHQGGPSPETKLLFVTMHSERPYLQAAFDAGASGYVLKSAPPEELLHAVQKVLAGHTYISTGLPGFGSCYPRQPDQIVKSLKLSNREREILQLVAEGKSSKEMAGILNVSVKTISFHRENIKRKLGVRTIAELTRSAIAGDFM